MTDLRNTDADQEEDSDDVFDIMYILLKMSLLLAVLFVLWVMK